MAIPEKSEQYMKYLSIRTDLQKMVQNGDYKVGHKLPSERSLATKFDASVMTVRRALSLLCEDGVIERVPGRGSFVLNPSPSAGVAASTSTVALLTIDNQVADPLSLISPAHRDATVRLLSDHMEKQGRSLIVSRTNTLDLAEGRIPSVFENKLAGGVFLYNLVEDYHIQFMRNMGLPVVVIGNRPIFLPVSKVTVDYRSIAYSATRALLDGLSGTVHLLTAPFIVYYEQQILEGYLQACHDAARDTNVVMYDYTQRDASRLREAISNVNDDSSILLNYDISYMLGNSDQVFPLDLRNLRAVAFGSKEGINPSILRRLNVGDLNIGLFEEAAAELMDEAIAGAESREIVFGPEVSTYEEDGLLRIDIRIVRSDKPTQNQKIG